MPAALTNLHGTRELDAASYTIAWRRLLRANPWQHIPTLSVYLDQGAADRVPRA